MEVNAPRSVLTGIALTLVGFLLTAVTRIAFWTVTHVCVYVIFTRAAIETGTGGALVHIGETARAVEAFGTQALEAIGFVYALTAISTGRRQTLVDVVLAVRAGEA